MPDPGKVIGVGQVIIDLSIGVKRLPDAGADLFGDNLGLHVGGEFNLLQAVRQMRIDAQFAGTLGTGVFSRMASEAMTTIGIAHVGATIDGDVGYCVALVDPSAERTFISTRGAETRMPPGSLTELSIEAGDVVCISGYSLVHSANREEIERFALHHSAADCRTIVDTSPVVGDVPIATLRAINDLRPLWTMNEREALILAKRFDVAQDSIGETVAALSDRLRSPIIGRAGQAGAWYCEPGLEAVHVPSIPVKAIDSNGAGDAHTGVLASGLALGWDIATCLHWSNVAGALTTIEVGPATCPDFETLSQAVAMLT